MFRKIKIVKVVYLFGLFFFVSAVGFLWKNFQKSGLVWKKNDSNFFISSALADGPAVAGWGTVIAEGAQGGVVEGGEGGEGGGGGGEGGEGGSEGGCGEGCESSSG